MKSPSYIGSFQQIYHILKNKYFINVQERYLDLFMILTPNFFDDISIQQYLLSQEDKYQYFLKTYGKSIHLNETNKENGIKISTDIQNFILYILKKLRSRLPFDDIVVQKISAFDPECGTTVEDIASLADKYDNIIEPDQYHIILSEIKDWEFEIKNSGKLLAKAKSHRFELKI
jgi:hypothetical protein